MKFEDLNNELDQFPEELNYSDEMWAGALSTIEAHEAAIKRRKIVMGLSSAALLALVLVFFPVHNQSVHSEYSPRLIKTQTDLYTYDSQESPKSVSGKEPFIQPSVQPCVNEAEDLITHASSTPDKTKNLTPKTAESETIVKSSPMNQDKINQDQVSKQVVKEDRDLTQDSSHEPMPEKVNLLVEVPKSNKGALDFSVNPLAVEDKISLSITENELSSLKLRESLLQRRSATKAGLKSKELRTNKKLFKIYKEFLGIKLGLNPWSDYGTVANNLNYNPSIGLYYENIIKPTVSWNIGIEYFEISALDLNVSSSNTSYNFSSESIVTSVSTEKAQFISAPISLGVRPFTRVQVKAGVAPGMLLQTENTLEESIIAYDKNEVLSTADTRGYRGSFETFHIAATVSANYWFSQRNSVQLTWHKGFTDFSKNEVFNNTNENLTSRIEVSLNRVIK